MSEKRKNIVYHITRVSKNGYTKTDDYENEKDFHKALKKGKKAINNVTVSVDNEDKEIPVYFIRSKAVFSDGENTLCIDNKGKLQKENKYEILKDKDGKDKYIIKKDENSYYRYSIDGRLIDSIKKNKEKNSYTYYAYKNDSKEKVETKISAEDIDKAIELSRGQIKIKKEIHGIQPDSKPEEILYDKIDNYVYPNGNELNNTFFGRQQYNVIREICEENGIKIEKEDYSTISLLKKLSLGLTKKENINNLDENDLFEAKKFILEKLFEKYNYKLVRFSKDSKRYEEFKKENINDILKNNELVDIIFSDKYTGNEVSRSSIKPMKLFDATNLAGVNGKGKSTKITRNGEVLTKGAHFFVKPVGKPMSFFKKTKEEFSNHSNFEYEGERKVEASGLLDIVEDGKIHNISNSSGHFKQSFESIMTGLAYLASQTEDCNIENLLDPDCKMKDGSYKILTDINEALQYRKKEQKEKGIDIGLSKAISAVAKSLTKEQIIAINIKAARMKAKESSKGRSIC